MTSRTRTLGYVGATVFIAGTAVLFGCRRESSVAAKATAPAQQGATKTVAVSVDGMICQVCAGSVKSALKRVPGVQDVEVSLEKRHAVIRYEDGKVGVDQLTRAISNVGFKPGLPEFVHR